MAVVRVDDRVLPVRPTSTTAVLSPVVRVVAPVFTARVHELLFRPTKADTTNGRRNEALVGAI
eukprot:scaffold11222_cov56-Attheya_sp.AAC.1